MAIYKVPVRYVFVAEVEVDASTPEMAREVAKRDCGVVINNLHTSNDAQVKNWYVSQHPDHEIIGIERVEKFDNLIDMLDKNTKK